MNIRPDQLGAQYERADRDWPWIHEVNAAYGLPPFLMHALGSRETNLANIMGDGGRGAGVWQRDIQHGHPEGWMDDIRWQCEWSAEHLAAKIARCGTLLGGVNSYNAGSCDTEDTTGGDYGPDVLERRAWLEANYPLPLDGPVDDTPPAELDPLAVNHGEHAVDVPRELEPLRFDLAPTAATTPVAGGDGSFTTVEKALAFLKGQLGLAEYPPGSNNNWITDWYYGWHAAWCAMTVSRALIEAGFGTAEAIDIAPLKTTTAKGWAYCPYIEADFRDAGRWHDVGTGDPQPGDLVLYDWDGDGWADHVGMLCEVAGDGTLWVYEGNTDEGVLRLKHRSRAYVRGFARPPYSIVTPPPDLPKEQPEMAIGFVTVRPGEMVSVPLPQQGTRFGTSMVSVTITAGPEDVVVRAVVGPDWHGLDPDHPEDLVISPEGRRWEDLGSGSNVLQITNLDDGNQSVTVLVEAK